MQEVSRRRSLYDSLMENPTSKKFYQLIRQCRSSKEPGATCIQVQDERHFDLAQQRSCFSQYYEDQATPKDMNYDNVFLELCNVRCANVEAEFSQNKHFDADLLISEADVDTAIDKLNNEKSADEYGLSSEHFKAAEPIIVPVLTKLFNEILISKDKPDSFKTGIITPVLKSERILKSWGIIEASLCHLLLGSSLSSLFSVN